MCQLINLSYGPVGRTFVRPWIKVSSTNSKFCDQFVPTKRVLTASEIKLPHQTYLTFRRTSDSFTKNTLENFNIVITSSYTNAKIKVSLSLRLARYLKIKLRTAFLKINQKKVIYTRLSDSFVVIMCYCYHWHHTMTTVRSTFHENTGDILDILTNLQFQFPLNTVRAERAKQC